MTINAKQTEKKTYIGKHNLHTHTKFNQTIVKEKILNTNYQTKSLVEHRPTIKWC